MHRYGHLVNTLRAFRNAQGHLWMLLRLSHGENRGSSPLGSASKIRDFGNHPIRVGPFVRKMYGMDGLEL
jgi:hypothetical protein